MGKSVTADIFKMFRVPAFSADDAVHKLYEDDKDLIAKVGKIFPDVTVKGFVDRKALSKRVQNSSEAIQALEAIVHPVVKREQQKFLEQAEHEEADIVVMNIPLLFETGGAAEVDTIVVVSAPKHVQRARVLARPGMTEEKFEYLLARQISDAEKRARANFLVFSDKGLDNASEQVEMILSTIREKLRLA